MALNIWTQPSGFNLGTFFGEVSINIPLPLLPQIAFNGISPTSNDGSGHHPTVPLRNSTGSAFVRTPGVNSYSDGIHAMRTDLPNARTVSNLVVYDTINQGNEVDPTGYSGFMYAWGQFITHDIEFARGGTVNIDVIVPVGDANLTPGSHIPVSRNAVASGTGVNGITAVPVNDITGWIDGGVVYGLTYPPGVTPRTGFVNPVSLREGGAIASTGKLLTSSNGQYGPVVNGRYLFGDPRGSENPDLTSIQTLFIREHNWHVDRLKALHPSWSGEQLYQRARSIVVAEEQIITYKEWLPKIIGLNAIPEYSGFKLDVDASVTIEFAVAAFRFGHSIVSGAQDRVDEHGNITEALTLGQAFFLTPAQFERNGGADGFLRKLASDITNKLDVHIIEDLRNLLDDPPAALDLAATNIQRGRDLGLPSLNQMRVALGLAPYTDFNQITNDETVATALETAYTNINDIDLWIGGLAENRVSGAMVGPTFKAIIVDQMTRLRDGDREWYKNKPWATADLEWLEATTLSDMILRNTDTVRMQQDAFVAVEREDLYNGTVTSIVPRTTSSAIPGTDTNNITFEIISGSLPSGLFLIGDRLIGSPFVKNNKLDYKFCVRATQGTQISDRTFYLNLVERNLPTFITPSGDLSAGVHQQFYVLDSTYVNYQLEAVDLNPSAQGLKFFIASGDGQLPPGLTLSESGLIEGFVKPLIRINPADGSGNFDKSIFDHVAYDFGVLSTNGFDDYQYDLVDFDFNLPTQNIITLNSNYQFRITMSDGINITQRIFRIFVVGNDAFRADSTELTGLAGKFTADATYIRQPFWITNPNLGTFRANNYITLPIVLYDNKLVVFRLETTNQEVYGTTLRVAQTDNIIGSNTITITNVRGTPKVGYYFNLEYYLETATGEVYQISHVTDLGNGSYRLQLSSNLLINVPNATAFYAGTLTKLPPGMRFDVQTGNVVGVVPYQPSVTQSYQFTITATRLGEKNDLVSNSRTFNLAIIGDINSEILWNSDPNLGTIPADYICTLSVSASSNIPNADIIYQLDSGELPNGLTLNPDGEIIGIPNQFFKPSSNKLGLITFDGNTTTFDQDTTTVDRTYHFVIKASDQYGYSAVTREFSITLSTPNSFNYSNITTKPFLNNIQRTLWKNFINDTDIFTPSSIYRANDPNFGIQSSLKMLVYAGIETKVASAYVGAMGLNHKRKRFHFGGVKKATAVDRITGNPIYEIVYIQMLDPLEPNGKHLPLKLVSSKQNDTITADNNPRSLSNLTIDSHINVNSSTPITVDSTGYEISDPQSNNYYPNSITNWRTRLKQVGASERNYLPLWMRSIPAGEREEIDYILAIPLCFCRVGTADKILLNIKFSEFDFKNIDYTIDRYIIDSVTGQDSDKYLVFRNDRITV